MQLIERQPASHEVLAKLLRGDIALGVPDAHRVRGQGMADWDVAWFTILVG